MTISDDEETGEPTSVITDVFNISSGEAKHFVNQANQNKVLFTTTDDEDDGDVEIINSPIRVKVEAENDEDCQITQVIENISSRTNQTEPSIPKVFRKVELTDERSPTNSTNSRLIENSEVIDLQDASIKLEFAESIDKNVPKDTKTERSDYLESIQREFKTELGNSDFTSDDDNATYVSADIYAREKSNFDTLVKNVLRAEEQLKDLEKQPVTSQVNKDALEEAKSRVAVLNKRLNLMSQYIDDLRIERESQNVDNTSISWDRVYADVNKHRLEATGSTAEFYQHKSNIISGLKVIPSF